MRSRTPLLLLVLFAAAAPSSACKPSRAEAHGEHDGHPAMDAGARPLPREEKPSAPPGHEGHAAPPSPEMPSGYAAVSLEPARAAAIGLTTTKVEERDFVRRLRTTGIVAIDETRTEHVHPKVRGWVDGIRVDFVGQKVSPGEVLCGIYSQEVYTAEIEYLALLGRTDLEAIPRGEFAEQEKKAREELLGAARRRLALWDVPKTEIARLGATREAKRTFPLLAPVSGVVVEKRVLDGMYVDPSVELYTLSDLSRVWLLADIYESDVASVHLGQIAHLEVQGLPGPIESKVSFLPPTIDQATRTLKARFDLPNKDGKLRPGAFATVTMDLPLGRSLGIPENAVIRTGTRSIVFVVHDGRHVMPREVTVGPLVDDFYRVDAGLSAGDVVATGAQFLLDSETRLRATSGPGAGHAGH